MPPMPNPFYTLRRDFQACFERDPAARNTLGFLEVLFTYSGYHALLAYRLIHFLHARLRIPVVPRILAQIVRFFTGIEIHPGARIGPGFFIDHGMGVVIGETAEVGENVTIYQDVTLGGTGTQRGKRHPTIGDNVVIGAGAKVLGNITIGSNVKIGAGSVVIHPVPDNSTVVGVPAEVVRREGVQKASAALDHGDLPDPIEELKEKVRSLQKEIEGVEEKLRNQAQKKN